MTYPDFETLNNRLIQLFQEQNYAEALDLATQEKRNFIENRPWIDYWRMCAAARTGDRALAYLIAGECHQDDLWYSEMMWRKTPSFQPLQGDPQFEHIVSESSMLQERDGKSGQVRLLHLPDNHSPASPLIIALHGNTATAHQTEPFWHAAVAEGWVLAIPQSSQAVFKGAYIWDDLQAAFREVQDFYAQLKKELAFDQKRVVLAGHSMGGQVAIQMALAGKVDVRGFVGNGPAAMFMDREEDQAEIEALLPGARERGTRGAFIVGEKDIDINPEQIKELAGILETAGIPCRLETVPEATHEYTPAYNDALLRALEFIDSSQDW